jgi:TonB family protein
MSKSRLTLLLVAVAGATVALALLLAASAPDRGAAPATTGVANRTASALPERAITSPVTYENLSLVLIRGPDRIRGQWYLTLGEALEQEQMTVHETGQVDQLAIDNTSGLPIFIQSGEIVRGGKQDRVLRYDMIVSAQARGVPMASFCVEQGRWSARGGETPSKFSASKKFLVSRGLRVSSLIGIQAGVWRHIGDVQGKLSTNLGATVNASSSPTSLELSLDNEELKRRTDRYIQRINSSIRTRLGGLKQAVGFAFAVNGEISSVQVYASGALFRRLYPKLLRAAAVEAISEHRKGRRYRGLRAGAVRSFMSEALSGKRDTLRLSDRVKINISATHKSVAYHTHDTVAKDVLHESYLAAGEGGLGRLGLDLGNRQNNRIADRNAGLIGNQIGEAYGVGGLIGNQIGEAYGVGGPDSAGTGRGAGRRRGRRLHPPRIALGRVEARGSLKNEVIRRIIRRHINEVKYCYQKELQANPDLHGRVVIQFTISPTGQVVSSVVQDSTLRNRSVETCSAMAARRWLFPRPRGGGIVVVTFPVTFRTAGG